MKTGQEEWIMAEEGEVKNRGKKMEKLRGGDGECVYVCEGGGEWGAALIPMYTEWDEG